MYGSFEGWYHSNKRPWETKSDAKARYESVYGKDDEELEVVDTPAFSYEPQETVDEGDDEEGFFGKGQDISSIGTGLGRSWDSLQASAGTFLSDKIAGNLPEFLEEYEQPLTDLGDEIYYRNIKEAKEDWGPRKPSRLEQRKLDDPNYKRALTKEEFIEQNPDHWKSKLYKMFPDSVPSFERIAETAPTAEEIGEMAITSVLPSVVGRVVGGTVGSVGGPIGTFTGQMAGGASASSAMTASEISREIRDNPTVRTALGLDPDVSYQDDSYENKNKMQRLAKLVWSNVFTNRLTSSGLPEMAGYAAFGKGVPWAILRSAIDVGGGTASELMDIDMGRRSIIESLKEYTEKEGEPLSDEQLAQIDKTLFEMGPKKRDIFSQAFIGELALGAPGAFIELGLEARQDHRVDEIDTDSAQMEKMQKEFDESDNKRLEIVGSPYEEIQTLYDEGNEEQAYELYKKINKENRKQNALSDLLQKNRYDDIYKDFLDRDGRAEVDQEVAEEVEKAEDELRDEATKELKEEVDKQVKTATEKTTTTKKTTPKKTAAKKVTAKKTTTKKPAAKKPVAKKTAAKKKDTKKPTTDTKKTEQKVPVTVKPESPLQELKDYFNDTKISKKFNRDKKTSKKLSSLDFIEDGKTVKTYTKKELQNLGVLIKNEAGQETVNRDLMAEVAPTTKATTTAKDTTKTKDTTTTPPKLKSRKSKDFQDSHKPLYNIHEVLDENKKVVFRMEWEGPQSSGGLGRWIDVDNGEFIKNESGDWAFNKKDAIQYVADGLASGRIKPVKKNLTRKARDKASFALQERELGLERGVFGGALDKGKKGKGKTERREALTDAKRKVEAKKGFDKANAVNKFIESGVKKRLKANPKATVETQNQWRTELTTEFLNKESSTKLRKEEKAKAQKQKDWEKTEDKTDDANEPIIEGKNVSSATGKIRKKEGKSVRTGTIDAPGISKEGVQDAIKTFKKNSNKKIKDMNITVLSKDDEADVQILKKIINEEYEGKPEGREEWVNKKVEATFNATEGFVENETNDVYIISNQIFGYETGKPTDRLAQVLFHETIGHVGLRQTLGDAYKTFINRFLKTNKKLLKQWATEGTGQVYLPKELRGKEKKDRVAGYDKMSDAARSEIADEYIATRFAEHGARDPNIIDRIGVHIARALNKRGIYKSLSINEVKMTLAEVQQDYIGGNRNFITGENFRKVPLLHYDDDMLEEETTGDVSEDDLAIREAGLLDDSELEAHLAGQNKGISKSVRIPKKTIKKVYKLMDIRDGKLYYPFVEEKGKDKLKSKPQYPVELGEWQSAKFVLPKDMPGRGRGMKLSPRGGFHLTENLTPHLKTKLKDGTTRVWVEVEIGDDVNYQDRVGEKGRDTEFLVKRDKDGNVVDGKVPVGGQYRFKRPAKEGGWWRIAGEMKLLRILPESESNTLLNEYMASKEYTDALAKKAKKKQKKETAEDKMLRGISQSKAMGMYARYNKDAGTNGTMLLHRNTRPDEGDYRITFFKEDGELDMDRTENKMGHEHFPTLAKAKARLNEVGEDIQDISGGRAISRSVRKTGTFREELAKAEGKVDTVSFSKKYGRKPSPELQKKLPKDTVVLSKEGVKKYLESKTAEGDGTVLGGISMSKRILVGINRDTRKKMLGKNAVAMVADRIKLEDYIPLHKGNSTNHEKMKRLHGGPDYAFEEENRSRDGETYGVWASNESRIKALANAIKRMGTEYGVIIVGNPEQHLSNMDVWNVMWGETLDAHENGLILENGEFKRDDKGNKVYTDLNWINNKINEFKNKKFSKSKTNPKNPEETLRWMEPLFNDEMKSKINDFNSLMEQGKNLSFDRRAFILKTLFGNPIDNYKTAPHIEGKANGVALHRIIRRTSAYPDAEMGDMVGVVKFKLDKDGNAIFGKASDIGIKDHPSYDTVIQGEGIMNYKKGIPMKEYAREWLMAERESGQKPFWKKGQVDFEDSKIYTSAMLKYIEKVKEAEAKGKKTKAKPPEIKEQWATAKLIKRNAKRVLEMKPDAGLKITKDMFPAEVMLKTTKVVKGQFSPETMLKPTKRKRDKSAISASKRLISQSVNYSNSRADNYERTRVASKGRGPLSAVARKLTRRLISQGTLEDYALYKQLRRRTKGVLLRMEQTAEKFYRVIKNSKQQKEIYDYLTTPDADRTKILNEYERKIVVQVKKEIRENGRRLVEEHHLMTRKTLDRLDDQYLPRKYLRYLLRDSDYALLSRGGGENIANLDLSYLNKRQDIEKGIRELILGEVKDPAFLSATAFATPRKDMALLDFMQQIAGDIGVKRGWVLKDTLVTFDTIGLMKQLAGESPETRSLIEELELMETKGVRVSGHWLVNEAERIQNLATNHMELTPEKTILVKKLTDRMSKAGKEIVGDVVPKDYIRVPKGRKYGKLQGMAIRKEIFEDLFGWSTGTNQTFNINDDGTIDRNIAEKILGTGGTFEQFNRFWKWSKVSANPPSWVRNFISNLIFMNMGPVPLHRMPDLFIRSIKDQISTRIKLAKGDRNNEIFDEKGNPLTDTARADIMGLTSGGFSQVELKMIKSNFEEAVRRGDPQEGVAGLMTIRNAFRGVGKEEKLTGKALALAKAGIRDPFVKYVQTPTSDLYGGIDTLGKVMMMKYLHGDHVRNPKTGKSFNERFGWMPFQESKKPKWEGANRLYSMDEAAAEAEKWLFDYSNPLPSVKYLRKSAFGAPFLSYPSFVAPLLIETILTRPWKFIPHILFGEAMLMGFKSVYDISDEEYEAVIDESNDYIKKRAKGGNLDKVPDFVPIIGGKPFIPRSIIPVFNPFSKEKNLDENGRAQLLDIGYLQPYGMFADVFRQLDPTKDSGMEPAQALHTFGLLSSPLINIATTILTNRDPFTDREIFDEFATGTEKLGAWGHYLWNLSMPPMVHGLTQIGEGKGFGAITRLIEQYTHFVTKEGEAKHTKTQAFWRAVGINITPIAPHEARGVNARREVAKINRLKNRIRKNAEDAIFNNVPFKDIEEMIREDVKKMEDLADALDKRLGTPLPASLKRTEKQRLEIFNKFLERRKAS